MTMCVLRIAGPDFRVDDFLAESPFDVIAVYRKGDPRRPASRGPATTSGFNVEVGGLDYDLKSQSDAAIEFIERHRQELERARNYDGVRFMSLDFATEFRDVAVQNERFPAELIAAAASVGLAIDLTLYPPASS